MPKFSGAVKEKQGMKEGEGRERESEKVIK